MYIKSSRGDYYIINPRWTATGKHDRIKISNLYFMSKQREEEEKKEVKVG